MNNPEEGLEKIIYEMNYLIFSSDIIPSNYNKSSN